MYREDEYDFIDEPGEEYMGEQEQPDYSDLERVKNLIESQATVRQDTQMLPKVEVPHALTGKIGDYRRFTLAGAGAFADTYLVDARIRQPDLPVGLQVTVFPDSQDDWTNTAAAVAQVFFGGGGSVGGGGAHGSTATFSIGPGVTIAVPGIYVKLRVLVSTLAAGVIGFGAFASLNDKYRLDAPTGVNRDSPVAAAASVTYNVQPFGREIMVCTDDNRVSHMFLEFIGIGVTFSGIEIPPGTVPQWHQIPAGCTTYRITNIGAAAIGTVTSIQRIVI